MYLNIGTLKVDKELEKLINNEILPLINMKSDIFWNKFEDIINELTPTNRTLLEKRDDLQTKIDAWHKTNIYDEKNLLSYKNFLIEIGYLVEEKEDFKITTKNVDEEISLQAGPQLVVPVKNARFALNAANARWEVCMMLYMEQM